MTTMTTSGDKTIRQIGQSVISNPLNDLKKQMISEILDPTAGMTEPERAEYENKIFTKLKMGKRLSSEEMEYLRLHKPELYRTALRVKMKKDQMKEQLKHCKSKEEVEQVISQAFNGVSDKDPDKEYLIAGLAETVRNFKKDSGYARLPETREDEKRKKGGIGMPESLTMGKRIAARNIHRYRS